MLLVTMVVAVVTAAATACRVDTIVTVDVEADGSGVVGVDVVADREAAAALGDPETALRLDDLAESGWTIEESAVDDDSGELAISGSRRFDSSEELARILAGMGADHGDGSEPAVPFVGDVKLRISDSSGRTDYDFSAALHVPGGLESLSDPALTDVLAGLPVGRTADELEAMGYDAARGLGDLRLRIRLPGKVDSTNGRAGGGYVEWSAPIGSDDEVDQDLTLKSVVVNDGPSRLRTGALVALVAAAALAGIGVARRH